MALTQAVYRFGSDDGNEATHGWLAAENTAIYVGTGATVAMDVPFLLRVGVQNATSAASNINFTIQYKINSGSWVTITTSSAGVKAVAAAALTNNGDTTQRLTGLTGTFQGATGQAEDGDAGGNSMDILATGNAEVIYGLQVNSAGVTVRDVITFQLLQEGSALGAYSVTPTLTIRHFLSEAPGVGEATLAGIAPTRRVNTLRNMTVAGAIALAGLAPTIKIGGTLDLKLYQGDTQITSYRVPATNTLATYEHTLTAGEISSVSDWSQLRYTLVADGGARQFEVTWAELEAPAAQGVEDIPKAPGAGSMSLAGLAPSVKRTYLAKPGAGSASLAGVQPTKSINYWYQADSVAVDVGSIVSGDVSSTWTTDGTDLVIAETTGNPAFTVDFTFSGINASARSIHFYGHYEGNVGHRVKLYQWNYTSSSWVALTAALGDLPHSTSDYLVHTNILGVSGDWVSGGQAKFRIGHPTAGATDHRLYVDEFTLEYAHYPSPAAGSMTVAGVAPTVKRTYAPKPTVGGMAFAGLQPTILTGLAYAPEPDGLALAGLAPAAKIAHLAKPSVGAMAFAGTESTVIDSSDASISKAPAAGSLTFSGLAPTVPALTFVLSEGETTRATRAVFLGSSLATFSFALTAEERASIANWATLRFSFVANGVQSEVAWAELEAPASGSSTVAPGAGTLSFAGLAPRIPGAGDHTISVGAGTLTFAGTIPPHTTVALYQDTTLIAERQLTLTESFVTYSFVLTSTEAAAITDWGDLYVVVTADGQQVSASWIELQAPDGYIAIGAGSLSFAGLAPSTTKLVIPDADALSLSGQAPTLGRTYIVKPTTGSMTVAGVAPSRRVNHATSPGSGSVSLAGVVPVASAASSIVVPCGSMSFTGTTATVFSPFAPAAASLTFSGFAPGRGIGYVLSPAVGSIAFSSTSPAVIQFTKPSVVGLTLAGIAPSVKWINRVEGVAGAFAFAGLAPSVRLNHVVSPSTGALAIDGLDVTAERPPDVIVRTPAVVKLTLAGQSVTLGRTYIVKPSTGSLTFAGFSPGRYPRALFWTEHSCTVAGIHGESYVMAGIHSETATEAGIAGGTLEYET